MTDAAQADSTPARESTLGQLWRHEARRNVSALVHVWRRLELVERLLAGGSAPAAITQRLMEECGISRREANRYQAAVRRRWLVDAAREDREQELLRIKAALWKQVERGDAKAATAALAVLARMAGGLDRPEPELPPVRRAPLQVPASQLSAELRSRMTDEEP